MATRLKMVYTDSSGGSVTHSWNYADPEVTTASVSALAQATITNNSIFTNPPVALKSATAIVTTETNVTPS